jgi:hypothetical protein
MCPLIAVRDRGERWPGLVQWIGVDVTCRLQAGISALGPWRREVAETGQAAGLAWPPLRRGSTVLSSGSPAAPSPGIRSLSRFRVRGPMRRRCPGCKPAARGRAPSVPRPGKTDPGGGWLVWASSSSNQACCAGAVRGLRRAGEWRSPCPAHWFRACSSACEELAHIPK